MLFLTSLHTKYDARAVSSSVGWHLNGFKTYLIHNSCTNCVGKKLTQCLRCFCNIKIKCRGFVSCNSGVAWLKQPKQLCISVKKTMNLHEEICSNRVVINFKSNYTVPLTTVIEQSPVPHLIILMTYVTH